MKFFYFTLIFQVFSLALSAQQATGRATENIVPNPGFEMYSSTPIGWFYKGEHFTQVMKYWNSPSTASPDVFGPKVRVPAHWAAKGFGQQQPHSGESMAGITVFGCEDGKPHCREYLQIQLNEPLVIGQNYYAEFWVSHLPRSFQTNNLGIYFSPVEIRSMADGPLEFTPQILSTNLVSPPTGNWIKVSGRFVAQAEADYLLLGNFFVDSLTSTAHTGYSNPLNYAYYYVDDVLLKKEEPILATPVKADDLTRITLKEGKVITLKNIFFDHDKADLLPRSYLELNKLLQLMRQNPALVIEIIGHTDSVGEFDYNLVLSQRRAKAVIDFLLENGIAFERVHYKGYGSSRPVASNDTSEGRQLNRRVEMLIVKM